MTIEITDNSVLSRYEITVDGVLGGFAEYHDDGSSIVFPHTLIDPSMRGRGLAAQLVRRALDDASAANRTVVAQCWYVAQFIDEHPDYAHLLAPSPPQA
ncbi:unannotated protein [freshwater metagenome]|uniref:Unannotated protein n=1 Tax=freshwater metagenome TaxID=449393 RepID=A0A6J7E766_9ZZZZ|nr:GNAT family N-acetyltransferase [Actinomycetota bacterium]